MMYRMKWSVVVFVLSVVGMCGCGSSVPSKTVTSPPPDAASIAATQSTVQGAAGQTGQPNGVMAPGSLGAVVAPGAPGVVAVPPR